MKFLLSLLSSFFVTITAFSQNVDTSTIFQWQNNSWQPIARNISSYNGLCLLSSVLSENWQVNSSSWITSTFGTHAYTGFNKIKQSIFQNWNSYQNTLDNYVRITYTYNNYNLVDSILVESWNDNIDNWQPSGLHIYSYNADETLKEALSQKWIGSWSNLSRFVYTYNADKTIDQQIEENWNYLTSNWNNVNRGTFTYNIAGKILTDTIAGWVNSEWKDSILGIYSYDANNFLINFLSQIWNKSSSSWQKDFQINYINNNDGTIAEEINQDWDIATSNWINKAKTTYHYSATCTLPLTLLNFTASLNGKAAQLQWTTTTEINTKNFIVQRSVDGIHFSSIGTVDAVGNSTQKTSYKFDDASALNAGANKLYYRLQMVDRDGKFTFSKIAIVEIVNGKLFVIYPNPAKDVLFIKTNGSLNNTEIRISDQSGKVVLKQQMANMQAGTPNKVNVGALNKGVYYLQLITGSDVQTAKFFKY